MRTIKPKKIYKTKIQNASDFGLFFNSLTRRYLWDLDPDLLQLILRILDRYLVYLSHRALSCSIRDLANANDDMYRRTSGDIPKGQRSDFDMALKLMIKRLFSMELRDSSNEYWRKNKIHELASECELTECHMRKDNRLFPSKEAFETWLYENNLDEDDNIPKWKGELLPIKPDFLPDFEALCLATVQYSYGRFSYMPSACRGFIRNNITLISDKGIAAIADDIDEQLKDCPIYPDGGGDSETKAWRSYAEELRRELARRVWKAKATDIVELDAADFESEISGLIHGLSTFEEAACITAWDKLDGIYRCLLERSCTCPDRKEYMKKIRAAKQSIRKHLIHFWGLDDKSRYIKVGLDLYMPVEKTGE